MKLYLARHGNTFDPGDKVVWTGKTNDLPLVAKGLEQAKAVAKSFRANKIVPKAVYCSSLKRTMKFAEIIVCDMKLDINPQIDSRLDEIDYGLWTGLTNSEVDQSYGPEEQKKWNEHSIFPKNAKWTETESKVTADIMSFTQDVMSNNPLGSTILIISSNGKMRYFLKLIPHEFDRRVENQAFKVKTGNVCRLDYEDAIFKPTYWNLKPEDIY